VDDTSALVTSNAGMRLMAQQMLYNRGDFARLRSFISESYTPEALEDQAVEDRLAIFESMLDTIGKLRVQQVIASSKHQAVVLMAAQGDGAFYMHQISVGEDYPHKISAYSVQPLGEN